MCARLTVLPFHPPGEKCRPHPLMDRPHQTKSIPLKRMEVMDAIAKTVAELTSQQDGFIRQQVIEQLMRQITHYDAEFRREEATSAVGSHAKH